MTASLLKTQHDLRYQLLQPGLMILTGYDDKHEETIKFSFRLNPSKLTRSFKKDGKYIRTKYGYERQNWGNSMMVFSYSGSSGVFKPGDSFKASTFDIRYTNAWIKFRELEDFFQNSGNSQNLVTMQYWGYGGEFEGSLEDFQFTHDADNKPYEIQYSFRFEGLPIRQPIIEVNQRSSDVPDPGGLGS